MCVCVWRERIFKVVSVIISWVVCIATLPNKEHQQRLPICTHKCHVGHTHKLTTGNRLFAGREKALLPPLASQWLPNTSLVHSEHYTHSKAIDHHTNTTTLQPYVHVSVTIHAPTQKCASNTSRTFYTLF